MKNMISDERAKMAYGAMAKKIAGQEITDEQQKAIDEMRAFRTEYKKLKAEYEKTQEKETK